jgi:hypothetical protein
MMSQKFIKGKFIPQGLQKKISLKSLKMSEHDDRKTFISSTDRQMDTTSNRSRRTINKQSFKMKKGAHKSNATPQKDSSKASETNIIITKRSEGQRVVSKKKTGEMWTNRGSQNGKTPLFLSKENTNSISTPLMV